MIKCRKISPAAGFSRRMFMKIIGVIAEYNPFHNGHAYLIRRAREVSGADAVVAVMSGDFVQRGLPAVFDKYTRTEMALAGGCDLALELPVAAAASSAQRFAEGSVAVLNGIGVVDELWFGSESGKMDMFRLLAPVLSTEPEEYRSLLRKWLAAGLSFPRAREEALTGYFKDKGTPRMGEEIREFLSMPNNILGLEYCIALEKTASAVVPRTIQRLGAGFNDSIFRQENGYNSASAIRCQIFEKNGPELLEDSVPPRVYNILKEACRSSAPVGENDFSAMLRYQLLREDSGDIFGHSGVTGVKQTGRKVSENRALSRYLDVTEDLALRIRNHLSRYRSFSQFAELLSAKNYPLTQMNRALLHILLNIREDDLNRALHPEYVHLLGFSEKGREVLREIKTGGPGRLCPVAKISSLPPELTRADVFASNLYEAVRSEKSGQDFIHEFRRQVIRV